MIEAKQLTKLGVPQKKAEEYHIPLSAVMMQHEISTPWRAAAFLAQLVHESNGFRSVEENLNYTPEALMRVFGKRFPPILAEEFGRTDEHPANQPMIAMVAYANRMGNGGVPSGDGWKYRGRSLIQLTGKDNYRACGSAIGIDLVRDPDQLAKPDVGCMAAGWFWNQGNSTGKSLNLLADKGDIDRISKVINGGTNGLVHRRSLFNQALRIFA